MIYLTPFGLIVPNSKATSVVFLEGWNSIGRSGRGGEGQSCPVIFRLYQCQARIGALPSDLALGIDHCPFTIHDNMPIWCEMYLAETNSRTRFDRVNVER